jgi:hypothetical protein
MYEKFLTEIEEEEASSGEQMERGASAKNESSRAHCALKFTAASGASVKF